MLLVEAHRIKVESKIEVLLLAFSSSFDAPVVKKYPTVTNKDDTKTTVAMFDKSI